MDTRKIEIDRFDAAVAAIRRQFPDLIVEVSKQHPHVEAFAEIPVQAGVGFPISINLQNRDELHLNAGRHFWVEWFPSRHDDVYERFLESVIGVLSGRYRIVEKYALGRPVKAVLERPAEGGKWQRVAVWSNLLGLLPLPTSRRILQNSGTGVVGARRR